jgi:hypothetical protein
MRGQAGCQASGLSARLRHRRNARAARKYGNEVSGACNDIRNGAGEGIRTLDPNLGKVVLYP